MKFLFLACTAVLLFSCTVTKVASNKDTQFSKRIDTMHIIVNGSASSDVYLYSLADYLRDELNKKGIKATAERPNPLSLESEKEMFARISKLNADVIMIINQTEARSMASGFGIGSRPIGATIDIQLFDPASEKIVWRANCKSDSQTGQGPAGKQSGKRIIEKLIADQLIQ